MRLVVRLSDEQVLTYSLHTYLTIGVGMFFLTAFEIILGVRPLIIVTFIFMLFCLHRAWNLADKREQLEKQIYEAQGRRT